MRQSRRKWICYRAVVLLVVHMLTRAGTSQTPSAAAPCKSTVEGVLEIVPLQSKVYSNTRNLRVWLPPGYNDAANAKRTYPVLYLLDAQMLFDRCTAPGQIAEWRVDETLTDLITKHSIDPIIVVGIDNTGRNRTHEFAPYLNPLLPPVDVDPPAGDKFPDFLAIDVLPFVTAHYRIAEGREHTGIGGSSLGAAAALYALLHRPDLFGLGLLESTSLQLGNGQLIRDTSPILRAPVRVAIGTGTEELEPDVSKMLGLPEFNSGIVKLNQTLADNFRAALFNHPEVRLTIQPGGHHTPQFWGERFVAAVQFLYPPAKPEVPGSKQ
jgi:enterochelin esterase-like enzyme